MVFKTGLKEFLNKYGENEIEKNTLRGFLSGEAEEIFESGYIGIHKSVPDKISDEILDLLPTLEDYIIKNWPGLNMDYHYNAEKGCYFLSTIFALATSWELVQGYSYYKNKDKIFYHSWVEKDGIVFDPAMRIVTTKERYTLFFDGKHRHNKQEVEELFGRTGTFTYYQEDLENGTINPLLHFGFYETDKAKEIANDVLGNLKTFIISNQTKEEGRYFFDDFDVTSAVKGKMIVVSYAIANKENITFEEAYEKFKASDMYKKLENTNNGLWAVSDAEFINCYYQNYSEKKY